MLFQKYSYPVINPQVDCFEILKDDKIHRINYKHKNFEKKLVRMVEQQILDWEDVSAQTFFTQHLSEDFMRNHVNDLDWWKVLSTRQLSESFMREIIDYIDWGWVIYNQKFYSKNMLREFKDRAVYKAQDGVKFDLEDLFSKLVYSIDE